MQRKAFLIKPSLSIINDLNSLQDDLLLEHIVFHIIGEVHQQVQVNKLILYYQVEIS